MRIDISENILKIWSLRFKKGTLNNIEMTKELKKTIDKITGMELPKSCCYF